MNDTSVEISSMQFEIFFTKTIKERFFINISLSDFMRETAKRRIKKMNPEFSEKEVIAELVRECYSEDFSAEEMIKIISFLKK